jgi:hypothetical protein
VTLADVRALMISLPEPLVGNAHWQYAGDLLLGAAGGQKMSIEKIDLQLVRALKADGLL